MVKARDEMDACRGHKSMSTRRGQCLVRTGNRKGRRRRKKEREGKVFYTRMRTKMVQKEKKIVNKSEMRVGKEGTPRRALAPS